VLSDFGLVPAAIMGVDMAKLLDRTEAMVSACMPSVPVGENPGVVLGAILGVAARNFGRDKVTIIASPGLEALGAWLEQLLAESTGKDGAGLIPIDREALGTPSVYGDDRLFVYLGLRSAPDAARARAVAELERAGHPVVRIAVDKHTTWARSSFAGSSRPPWPVPFWAFTRSISRTWKPART
jgi:transaldolase/glucose-6-phosphate isomerase